MAISDIYNSLTFGGVNSLDYGIYISGPGVFNAPTRAINFVDVPGRNGAIEIDEGHWNNIEVRYTAGTFGDDQSDFASKINAFRNAIVSQIGYQRITDTYNPEEFRLGIYASGLSVAPVNRNEAGEFELVFNCKPQRYLTDGETPISVSSGDTVTNPTLYDAGPLLAVEGHGDIHIGDVIIDVTEGYLGEIQIAPARTTAGNDEGTNRASFNIATVSSEIRALFNDSDLITISPSTFKVHGTISSSKTLAVLSNSLAGASTNFTRASATILDTLDFSFNMPEIVFPLVGSPSSVTNTVTLKPGTGSNIPLNVTISFNQGTGDITATITVSTDYFLLAGYSSTSSATTGRITGYSTQVLLGNPTYIDLEIGDVYKFESGEYVDLNKYIILPSDLPKLKSGDSTITFDNTITALEITPRWWEL